MTTAYKEDSDSAKVRSEKCVPEVTAKIPLRLAGAGEQNQEDNDDE